MNTIITSIVVTVIFSILIYLNYINRKMHDERLSKIMIKEKEYTIMFCSNLIQQIISDLKFRGLDIGYVNISYVLEKVVIEWLGWLMVNNINGSEEYINNKCQQVEFIILKGVGKVNIDLLQKASLKEYIHEECYKWTRELINGLLTIKKLNMGNKYLRLKSGDK